MKSLQDHITENHNGNKSAFGRAHGLIRQEVNQYLNAKKPVFVIDGKLVQIIRNLEGEIK
jgi:hypothetical protein